MFNLRKAMIWITSGHTAHPALDGSIKCVKPTGRAEGYPPSSPPPPAELEHDPANWGEFLSPGFGQKNWAIVHYDSRKHWAVWLSPYTKRRLIGHQKNLDEFRYSFLGMKALVGACVPVWTPPTSTGVARLGLRINPLRGLTDTAALCCESPSRQAATCLSKITLGSPL